MARAAKKYSKKYCVFRVAKGRVGRKPLKRFSSTRKTMNYVTSQFEAGRDVVWMRCPRSAGGLEGLGRATCITRSRGRCVEWLVNGKRIYTL